MFFKKYSFTLSNIFLQVTYTRFASFDINTFIQLNHMMLEAKQLLFKVSKKFLII